MANLTLAIDAQLLKDARTVAFERETTLTEMIREFLKELSRGLAIKRRMEARQLMKSIERNSRHFGGMTLGFTHHRRRRVRLVRYSLERRPE